VAKTAKKVSGFSDKGCSKGFAYVCWIASTKQDPHSRRDVGLERGASSVETLLVEELVIPLTDGELLFRIDGSINERDERLRCEPVRKIGNAQIGDANASFGIITG
jgi:hypothetical protein